MPFRFAFRVVATWLAFLYPALAGASRPNIVLILADDLGYGDLSCYNPESKIRTPNLDRLAREGRRLTDAHTPSGVCTPTRYALLTGRYPWRSRLKSGVLKPWDGPLIEPGRLTVGQMLREHGYATACFGKWHLGWDWPTKDGAPAASGQDRLSNVDFTKAIPNGPLAHGFDAYFGVDLPNYPPYCFVENDLVVQAPTEPDAGKEQGFNRPGPMVPGWKLVDVLPEVTRRAVRHVEEASQAAKPFFLYLALTSPHYPVVPAPEFVGKSGAGAYGDFVVQTDWVVGRVMDALEKSGAAKNTLVIFTSDNGPEVTGEVRPGVYDRAKEFGHFSAGPLRGAKRDAWEGGHRVPFVARWPGVVPAGTTCDETIGLVDFMATVAAVLGSPLPKDAGEDSFSFLAALRGEARPEPRPPLIHHACLGRFAIRQNDWVLIDGPTGDDNGKSGETAWFKERRGYKPHDQPVELYNLKDDLAQRHNLAAREPELVQKMKELLEAARAASRTRP